MTGNDDGKGIGRHDSSHGPCRSGSSDGAGQRSVGGDLAPARVEETAQEAPLASVQVVAVVLVRP